eukprot:8495766-Pyramimonas_sp.AAC.1
MTAILKETKKPGRPRESRSFSSFLAATLAKCSQRALFELNRWSPLLAEARCAQMDYEATANKVWL